jgi:hypothetical protein
MGGSRKLKAAVKQERRGVQWQPGSDRYSVDRATHLERENDALRLHFAEWVGDMTGLPVRAETLCEDLESGQALCSIVARIPGSGLDAFHDLRDCSAHLQAFKGRDNMTKWADACRRLGIPDPISSSDLAERRVGKVIACLLQVQDLCDEDGIGPESGPPSHARAEPVGAAEPAGQQRGGDKRESKSRASSSRKRGAREQSAMGTVWDVINKIKIACGCGKKTVVD